MAKNPKAFKKLAMKQLQQYGDQLLGIDGSSVKKKRTRTKEQSEETIAFHSKSKKKKKGCKTELTESGDDESLGDSEMEDGDRKEILTGRERHLEELKVKLGLTDEEIARLKALKEAKSQPGKKPVQQRQRNRPPPEIVVFEDPAKRKQKREAEAKVPEKTKQPQKPSSPRIQLHSARHDIFQFGIGGKEPEKRQEAQVALAIKLGAKPPKRKHINYKEFQEMRKREKEEEMQGRELQRRLGFKVSNPNKQNRSRRKRGAGYVDGQVGQYKRGVQVLTNKDIESVKKFKRAK